MNSEEYNGGIGVTAGAWMLKWNLLDQQIHDKLINDKPGDDINVFINFECILKNLSTYKSLNSLVAFHKQDLVIELESSILNLIANYRAYFKKEKYNPKLYFYYTDLNFETQSMHVYNKSYRNYYKNRYTQNPQFNQMSDVLLKIIIPEIKLILSYCPGCYFIESKTFDSSIIPYIISTQYPGRNVIISGDVFDTLYMFDPNFIMVYIKRRFQHFNVCNNIDTTVQSIVHEQDPFDLTIFRSEMYYRLLISIKGSKIRNIKSAKGFGYGKFITLMREGIRNNIILKDFSSLDSILDIFPEKYRNDIKEAFQCTSIYSQYSLLNNADIDNVINQIVDKVDMKSLEALNNKRFFNHPINLQSLIN